MSAQTPFGRRGRTAPAVLPKGDLLGTYETYQEAQAVVDRLAKAEFPVSQVAIIGSDLRTVERVTGRLTYGRAAIAGAASGAWMGLFFGLLLTLFSPSAGAIAYLFAAVAIGAGFGMLFGIVSYSINRRRHDFTSVHQVIAAHYEIVCDPQLSAQAQAVLARPVGEEQASS
jgi:hypothetical protein